MAVKKFFEIEFKGGSELIRQIAETELQLSELAKTINAAKRAGDSDVYTKLRIQQEDLKRSSTQLKTSLKDSIKSFETQKAPIGSLVQLRNEYSLLIKEIANFSRSQRESAEGAAKIKLAGNIKKEILEIDGAMLNSTSNIGNYKSALTGLGDILTGGLVTGGAVATVALLSNQFRQGFDSVVQYSDKLAEMSAITGVVGADLGKLEEAAEGLTDIVFDSGSKIKNTSADILEAFKLVGGARPELLKNSEALAAVTREAIILNKSTGGPLADSVKTLTTVMGQFGVEADGARQTINELAAGSKVGAAETVDVADAIAKFGLTAKNSNISVAESVAITETLAERQLKGAEAGTQLRNVLIKLSAPGNFPKRALEGFQQLGIDLDIVSDKTLPLEERLKELGKAQGQTGLLARAFGVENLNAATILTENVASFEKFKAGIEGTNTAYEQAEIIANSYGAKLDALKKDYNEIRKAVVEWLVEGLAPVGAFLVTFVRSLKELPTFINENKTALGLITLGLVTFNAQLIISQANALRMAAANKIATLTIGEQTVAQWLLNAAMTANPLGVVLKVIGLVIAAFGLWYANSESLRNGISNLWNGIKNVFSGLGAVISGIGKLFETGFLQGIGKIAVSILKGFTDGFKSIGSGLTSILEGNIKEGVSKLVSGLINLLPLGPFLNAGKALGKMFFKGMDDAKKEVGNKPVSEKAQKDLEEAAAKSRKALNDLNEMTKKYASTKSNTTKQIKLLTTQEKQERAKADKERDKSLEDQIKKIAENEKRIQELTAKSINNVFDREIAENEKRAKERISSLEKQSEELKAKIEKQNGKKTESDKKESGLIAQETEQIKSALEKQNETVKEKREQAFKESKQQLVLLQKENLKAISELSIDDSKQKIATIQQESTRKIETVELVYRQDQNELDKLFAGNLISQDEFNKRSKALDLQRNTDKLNIERDTTALIYEEQLKLLELQKELINQKKELALDQIDTSFYEEQRKLTKEFAEGKIKDESELNARLQALNDQRATETKRINDEAKTSEIAAIDEVKDAALAANNAIIESDNNVNTNALLLAEERKQKVKAALNFAIDLAGAVSDGLFDLAQQDADREKEVKIKGVEEEYEKKLELAAGNKTLEEGLKKQLEADKLNIEKKAFEENKKRQIKQALANASLAIIQSLANTTIPFPFSLAAPLLIATKTAFEIASIKRQTFAEGGQILPEAQNTKIGILKPGIIKEKPNAIPTKKGDNVLIYAKPKEMVLTETHQERANKLVPGIWSKIGVPGFADGGVIPNISGVGSSRTLVSSITISQEQMDMFARKVAKETHDAVLRGSRQGTKDGSYEGAAESSRLKERQARLVVNTEF